MKILIDLDDPELPPLFIWLRMLKIVRIQHEFHRDHDVTATARRLEVSRFTIHRALNEDTRRAAELLKIRSRI